MPTIRSFGRFAALVCGLYLVLSIAVTGCSSSTAADAAVESGIDASMVDATDVTTVNDADATMVCDAGMDPPSLPQITSSWVVTGGDAGARPTPSGGDPTGNWIVTHATTYLTPAQASQIDLATSSITGTGWIDLTATDYHLKFDFEILLDTNSAGLLHQGLHAQSYGTYTVNGSEVMFAPACTTVAAGAVTMLGFSRDAPDRGRVFASGTAGTLLVLDVVSAP